MEQNDLCEIHYACDVIGKRWSGLIIAILLSGPKRFSVILNEAHEISQDMLSKRLKELIEDGIVVRTVYTETPVRVEYHLTDKGRDLDAVMAKVSEWAWKWGQ